MAPLLSALPEFQHSDFWTEIPKDSQVYFLDLAVHRAPTIGPSVIVSADFHIKVIFGETMVRNCADMLVPEKNFDLIDLKTVLEITEQTSKDVF